MGRTPWDISREMFLSLDEVERLLGHVRRRPDDGDRVAAMVDRVIVETLLFSGVRSSEFCRLKLGDFTVYTDGAFVAVGGRTVWLPRALGQLLRRYVERVRPKCLADRGAKGGPGELVVTERGRAFERTGLYRRVVRVLTAAGLGDRASVQLLRHTYGYLAYLRTGGNLLFVQRQLGHAHPMITSIYAQFVDEDYGRLADNVAGGRRRVVGRAAE